MNAGWNPISIAWDGLPESLGGGQRGPMVDVAIFFRDVTSLPRANQLRSLGSGPRGLDRMATNVRPVRMDLHTGEVGSPRLGGNNVGP